MKIIVLIFLIFGHQKSAYSGDEKIPCEDSSFKLIDEVLKLSCNVQDITKDILENKEVVPSKLYHYGKQEYLDKNISAGTVPEKDWNEFIIGDETRYKQGLPRRGLYGTSGVDTNHFGGVGDSETGLMEISIKPECRKPERVAEIHVLSKDKRFIKWFEKKGSALPVTFKKFAESCFSEECEKIILSYLEEEKIGVVQDDLVNKSFYIRDRSCIETIKGTSKELLEIFSKNKNLWISRCGSMHILPVSNILVRAMAKHDGPIDEAIEKGLIDNLKLAQQSIAPKLASALAAKKRCDLKKSEDFKIYVESKDISTDSFEMSALCLN